MFSFMRNPIVWVLTTFALATLACGINFQVPVSEPKTGPTVTDPVRISVPENASDVDLTLSFGAGKITLAPGAEAGLLTGTATYNVPDFRPEFIYSGNRIRIEQGDLNLDGMPNFDEDIKNDWDFKLSQNIPVSLTINAGAYVGSYDLGGLRLTHLSITDGAADVTMNVNAPNLSPMDRFTYNTGASNVFLDGLANLNAKRMVFRSGAGSYKFDFSGLLQQDMTVSIDSGISNLVIIIPANVPAELTFEGGMSNVTPSDSWNKQGNVYTHAGAGGPKITLTVKMGAGNLELHDR